MSKKPKRHGQERGSAPRDAGGAIDYSGLATQPGASLFPDPSEPQAAGARVVVDYSAASRRLSHVPGYDPTHGIAKANAKTPALPPSSEVYQGPESFARFAWEDAPGDDNQDDPTRPLELADIEQQLARRGLSLRKAPPARAQSRTSSVSLHLPQSAFAPPEHTPIPTAARTPTPHGQPPSATIPPSTSASVSSSKLVAPRRPAYVKRPTPTDEDLAWTQRDPSAPSPVRAPLPAHLDMLQQSGPDDTSPYLPLAHTYTRPSPQPPAASSDAPAAAPASDTAQAADAPDAMDAMELRAVRTPVPYLIAAVVLLLVVLAGLAGYAWVLRQG